MGEHTYVPVTPLRAPLDRRARQGCGIDLVKPDTQQVRTSHMPGTTGAGDGLDRLAFFCPPDSSTGTVARLSRNGLSQPLERPFDRPNSAFE
jgi:hypothetical protein